MAYKLLLDTNVFIDALANREPYAKSAKLILALGKIGEFELWCSAAQVTDIFNILGVGRFYCGLIGHIEIVDAQGLEEYARDYFEKALKGLN